MGSVPSLSSLFNPLRYWSNIFLFSHTNSLSRQFIDMAAGRARDGADRPRVGAGMPRDDAGMAHDAAGMVHDAADMAHDAAGMAHDAADMAHVGAFISLKARFYSSHPWLCHWMCVDVH